MNKKWNVKFDGRDMELGNILTEIIKERQIDDLSEFICEKKDIHIIDYEKLHNINKAYEIINEGVINNKSFLIYADVDVDGVTSGTIMYRYLKHLTDNVKITINNGKKHGVSDFTIPSPAPDIVIVVDSINENKDYDKFINQGIQVVIFDHHLIPKSIDTNSDNPLIISSADKYDNPELSGAGVTWKFCKYYDYMTLDYFADDLVDLATCGIIADMSSMASIENRNICYQGIHNVKNTGIKCLIGGTYFNSRTVSFNIAPLVNACQRMNKNVLPLKVFISDDVEYIKSVIKEMKVIKDMQNEVVDNLMPTVLEQVDKYNDRKICSIVIKTEYGVSGLIANKIMELFQKPVLILQKTDNSYSGSARGIGIESFKYYCENTGLAICAGHDNAFGIEIPIKNYDKFLDSIENELSDIEFENIVDIDMQLNPEQITENLIETLYVFDKLSGKDFPPIRVCIKDFTDYELGSFKKKEHLKLESDAFLAIKWNFNKDKSLFDGRPIDIAGSLQRSTIGKTWYNQLIIDDYKIGSSE